MITEIFASLTPSQAHFYYFYNLPISIRINKFQIYIWVINGSWSNLFGWPNSGSLIDVLGFQLVGTYDLIFKI